jgi:hypothetical protein
LIFDTALEDVRVDPDPNVQAPLPLTLEHIINLMDQVADAVFPHCALEIQKLWINRGMRKPIDMTTCKTAAAIMKIKNSLPPFPLRTNESKFSDQELVGLIKWSLPPHWRKKFDLCTVTFPLLEQKLNSFRNVKPSNGTKQATRSARRTMTATTTELKNQVRKFRSKSSKKWSQQ